MRISLLAALLLPFAALAQAPSVVLPDASPRARVEQNVGLTEMSVRYNRPAVNKRKVYGALVPWDQTWRAGANENTIVSFSTPVQVEGKPLAAGSYGLHMIPSQSGAWQVAFSSTTSAWGSFSYDAKEDALRVSVQTEPAAHEERLLYTFDDPTDASVTLSLRWEKLRVPIHVTVDPRETVAASLRAQLRGLPRFGWRGWSDAANWCLLHDACGEDAEKWIDRSLQMNPQFGNQMVKARFLEKKGDAEAAKAMREKALAMANEAELNAYGYQLLFADKNAEAIAVFRQNAKAHPQSWNVYDSLAEALAKAGDKSEARDQYQKAASMVKDAQQKARIEQTLSSLQ